MDFFDSYTSCNVKRMKQFEGDRFHEFAILIFANPILQYIIDVAPLGPAQDGGAITEFSKFF